MWKQIFTATINILFLADEATIRGSAPYMDATLFYYVNF
nr:MAG TPA: hypothetical protein [Caudoviricetes sp.]